MYIFRKTIENLFLIKKAIRIRNALLYAAWSEIKIGQILYIRYFYVHKKKRKLLRFFGLCVNKKPNLSIVIKTSINKEPIQLIFNIFNPVIINTRYIRFFAKNLLFKRWFFHNNIFIFKFFFGKNFNQDVYNIFRYEVYLVSFLILNICSNFQINKFKFLSKIRYKFR